MAIDTAAKRRSVCGVPFLPLGPGVTPDAAKAVAWRQQAGWGYSGIAAGAAAAITGVTTARSPRMLSQAASPRITCQSRSPVISGAITGQP